MGEERSVKQRKAAYYLENADKIKQRAAERYKANDTSIKKRVANYRCTNSEVIKQRRHQATKLIRLKVISHYGLKCSTCGEDRIGALQIDHIFGGGRQHIKNIRADLTSHLYHQYIKTGDFPPEYQTLCANCNIKKHNMPQSHNASAIRAKRHRIKVKLEFMNRLGAKCFECGCSDIDVLTAGHPNNDGAQHRREVSSSKAGHSFYKALLESGDFSKVVCQCFSCNCHEAYGSL